MKLCIWTFLENLSKNIRVLLKSYKNDWYLHEDVFTFMTIPRLSFLRMRNLSDKSCTENQNTHFMFNTFFPKMLSSMKQCRKPWWNPRGHKWQYNTASAHFILNKQGYTCVCKCVLPRALATARTHARTYTHKYVILIAVPLQQWFRESASLLHYTYILSCLYYRSTKSLNKRLNITGDKTIKTNTNKRNSVGLVDRL
jgi:hypothetical protein